MAQLKSKLYALEHPGAPGLYFRLDGEKPRLTQPERACLAPHTPAGLRWITERAQKLWDFGVPHEVVRLDA